jgi:hypothetical protein
MNEIGALILLCFASDESLLLRAKAESDAFFCFSILMTKMRDNFFVCTTDAKSLDSAAVAKRVNQFTEMLRRTDLKLFTHFKTFTLDARLYCVRWFMNCFV